MIHTVLIIILSAAVILLTLRILSFKKALRDIRRELELTRKSGYNRALTVTLFDKDLTDTASEINKNLDFQKKLKFDAELKERALKQSVSDIAHDLRTPLTVIKGNLSLLEDEVSFPDEARSRLNICSKKADSIRQMADSFFELALLESDGTAAVIERTDAAAALMQLIADNEAVIRQSGLEPNIIFPEKSVFILADKAMLSRILENLLANVLRYASDTFTVRLDSDGCISFSNAVTGIYPDTSRIFDRTYRSGEKGTGLGLYIVRLLAEKQGGAVYAETDRGQLFFKLRLKRSNE